MKNSILKKAFCLAVCLMMLLPLAACQGTSSAPAATSTPQEATSAPAASSAAASTAPAPAESANAAPTEIDVFLNMTWYPTDKFEGAIPEAITKATNIVLKPTRAADAGQLGLMIASQSLPEMVFTDVELSRLSDSALCMPYNKLMEQYTPDWKPSQMAITNASSYAQDGNYYFLFSHAFTKEQWDAATSGVPMADSLFFRADIVKALGVDINSINTIDDLTALFQKVKDYENGKGMWVYCPGMEQFGYFKEMYGITGNTDYQEVDGKYVHTINYANYEKYLKLCNDYFRKGFINPDGFAMDEATSDDQMISGKTFSYTDVTQGYAYTETHEAQKIDPNASILEMKPLGDDAKYRLVNLGWSGTFISNSCKHPEQAIKLMQFLFSDVGAKLTMWGREGIDYTLQANGAPKFSDDWVTATQDEVTFASKYNTNFYFGTTGLYEAIGRTAALGQEYQDIYTLIRKKIVVEPWYTLAAPKDPNSDEYTVMTKLQDLMKTSEPTIIQSKDDAEFAANMQKLKDDAKQIGIDKLDAYMNTNIPKCKALYN